jgi:hypothetical protein
MANRIVEEEGAVSRHVKTFVLDPEIAAISAVNDALTGLDSAAQQRVLNYVAAKLNLISQLEPASTSRPLGSDTELASLVSVATTDVVGAGSDGEDLDGISSVAIKWMRRNGLTADGLAKLFSLGVDDIDLVAKAVPGENKKERMHSVFLLKGVAAYLGSGVARVSHDQVKEACLHYDAFDTNNFASYLKSFAAEVSGSKEAGYTLTARGLTSATETVKEMLDATS